MTVAVGVVCLLLFPVQGHVQNQAKSAVRESVSGRGITWMPQVRHDGASLVVTGSSGIVYEQHFVAGQSLYYSLVDMEGNSLPDGYYSYKLSLIRNTPRGAKKEGLETGEDLGDVRHMGRSGTFAIRNGTFISGDEEDDKKVVIQAVNPYGNYFTGDGGFDGDLGLGVSDGYNPQQELHIRDSIPSIRWDDTGSGQVWDWEMNADHMRLYDRTAGTTAFNIAPGTADYTINTVGSVVGIGTSSPTDDIGGTGRGTLFIDSGTNPALILNQSTVSPRQWAIFPSAADGALIFYDMTDASLDMSIEPNGYFGFGTTDPLYAMHLVKTGVNAAMVLEREGGATNYINATSGFGNFGTVTDHPLRLVVNSLWKLRLDSDQSLTMANGATCTAGGTWQNSSSRALKENIDSLTTEEALDALEELDPVKFNYKVDKQEKHVGFVAEDVPELVASKDRKGMSPMDVVAVLTKVVQEQQKTISTLQERITELEKKSEKEK